MPEVTFRRDKELFGQTVVIGVSVLNLANCIAVEAQKYGSRIGENDRRMCGNQKLRSAGCFKSVDDTEEAELPLRR